jgi:hypothetical protein
MQKSRNRRLSISEEQPKPNEFLADVVETVKQGAVAVEAAIEEAAEAVEHFVERMAEPAPKVEYELPPDAPVETSAAVLAPTPVPPEASAEKSR